MGYILPIRPLQSEQYAIRLNIERYNFASVEKPFPVQLESDILEGFEEKDQSLDDQQDNSESNWEHPEEEKKSNVSPDLFPGYIAPNPVNLSPAISHVVGKGIAINAYA